VEVRRIRQGGRLAPLVGSRPVALRSSPGIGAGGGGSGIQDDRAQTVSCPGCGEPNPGRARFCLACGAPLPSRARPAGTRKAVTVVFSDLTGSTALGERLDPESLSRVMAHYYEAMRAVVLHHGGTVEGFAGDAVMAVFGVPAAHEDDALRAVRAAAGMHAALAELNQRLEREWGVRLELHTGVNTGEILLGRLGFDEPDFLGAVQASRDLLASRVEAVLAEARQDAGDDPVDPQLLLTLTEALAAAFDPGYH
jgi:hypothetical protein